MSQENVEIVRSILDSWNRRDYSAALELVAPEIRVEGGLDVDTEGTYEGIPDLQKWLARFFVVEAHHYGRGRASGVDVEMRNWHVFTVRDVKVMRWRLFPTKPEALEAVGLSE
jgi:ketosteroid isomerase-like protein